MTKQYRGSLEQAPIEDFLDKLIHLEKVIGARTKYRILEPFGIQSRDAIEIQTIAKYIADFIGLSDFTFVVSIASLDKNTGGNIELAKGQQGVFIEISSETAQIPKAILATLSHELAHKYLQVNDIAWGDRAVDVYANEVLTDIAAVFLGLGKLMLNGCECETVQIERVQGGTRTIQRTLKSGYLNRTQLAFVYATICSMRNLELSMCQKGLSDESVSAFKDAMAKLQKYSVAPGDQRNSEGVARAGVLSKLAETTKVLSSLEGNLKLCHDKYLNSVQSFVLRSQNRIHEIAEKTNEQLRAEEVDPCLGYLHGLRIQEQMAQSVEELELIGSEGKGLADRFRPLTRFIRKLPEPSRGSQLRTSVARILNYIIPRE